MIFRTVLMLYEGKRESRIKICKKDHPNLILRHDSVVDDSLDGEIKWGGARYLHDLESIAVALAPA